MAAVPDDALFDILKPGYSDLRDLSLALNGKPNEIDLVAGGAIRGRVVNAAGNPVRNFKIRVMIPRDLAPQEGAGEYFAGFEWYGVDFTRDDGVFVLSALPAGNWTRLIATSPGTGLAIVDRERPIRSIVSRRPNS